jgi:hypothetical protein
MQTCLDDTGQKTVRELYQAVNIVADDSGLLACIDSWGDTMDDADVSPRPAVLEPDGRALRAGGFRAR